MARTKTKTRSGRASAPTATVDGALRDAVRALSAEVENLRRETAQLKQRATAPVRPPSSPDDVASAVQHSVDRLQTRLAATLNPVSDFAVRELRVELSLHLSVTPLGTIEYRFPEPGVPVDGTALSRLTLTVVPVPKSADGRQWTRDDFTPDVKLEEVEGIARSQLRVLHRHHLYTVGDLLAVGSRARSQVELASLLAVDRRRLGEWLSNAELLTVRGIDAPRARVLRALGVTNLAQLAARAPDALATAFNERAKATRPRMASIEKSETEAWVKAAGAFVRRRAADTPAD